MDFIIKIYRKLIIVAFMVVVAISICCCIYSLMQNRKYESISAYVLDSSPRDVEIFDISKGEQTKRIQINPKIRRVVVNYLQGITGMYVKADALPKDGKVIRVPLDPSVKAESQWLKGYGIDSVEEVFIFLPEQRSSYLLVLDSRHRPLFYTYDRDIDQLLKLLDF